MNRTLSRKAALAALLILSLLIPAALAESPSYDLIYGDANPVPDIAQRVRPAVVQVINKVINWSKETGEVERDMGFASGVYFDAEGYVLTNNHVVEGADRLEVITLSGETIPAELVGADDGTDLAVIRLEKPLADAQPVPFGDSDALRIGELAIAIGNPGASRNILFGTVTCGVISAIGREDVNASNFTRNVKVIQTDAAINTGSSGGALLNAKGELIGVPTLKFMADQSAIYESLGFAIPINTAKPIIEQLIASGRVVRPRLGVMVIAVDGPDRPLRGYAPAGVQAVEVEPGTPADKAGVMKYDIILEIDGLRVKTVSALTTQIDTHEKDEKVKLKICRYFNPVTGEPLEKFSLLEVEAELKMID